MKEKITWKKGVRRINFPTMVTDPFKAMAKVKKLKLPKHRLIGFEVVEYTGKKGFVGFPQVYIER